MRQIVIMPGGFHPFHAGHAALYKSAIAAFNNADTYVAATNDTKTRPFPFAIKEKLAKLAGVADKHFVQVKSPFQPIEITGHYNPEEDVLIFVRSDKDRNESPKPGGTKKDGSPAYFQSWTGKNLQPFSKHAYIAYLPTVEFGPGITSASEIRNAWPTLNDKRRTAMVMSLYPVTQKNPKLAANVVKMLDMGMGNELDESWKNAIAGGAMALSALGAGAQTMPNVNAQQVELTNKYYNVLVQRAKEDGRELDRRTLNFLKAKAENAAALKIQQSSTQSQPQSQPQQGFPTQGSERKVSKDINNFESKKLNEFVPPSSDGGGENDRNRRIRKLLEIAIQVAKEKNVDELGMIHAMNMIAGDDFFSVAVEGILPDITDKEYMFVLQSAYKTVKQGLAEGKRKRKKKSKTRSLGRYFFPGYGYYGGSGESGEGGGEGGGDGGGEGVAEAEKIAKVFHPQYVDVYYLDGPRRTPILVNRKVPYNLIDRYLEVAIKKYNLQQGRFEFRNAEEDPVKVTESVDYLEEK